MVACWVLASEEDEREAWDDIITASINLLDGRPESLTQRYITLFTGTPVNRLEPNIYTADKKQLIALEDAQSVVSRLMATFKTGPCEVCQKTAGTRCSRCKQVFFCGKSYQTQVFIYYDPNLKHCVSYRMARRGKTTNWFAKNLRHPDHRRVKRLHRWWP